MQALQSGARVVEAVLGEGVEPCPCCKETDHDLNGCPQFEREVTDYITSRPLAYRPADH